ncbi:hypothetical protein COO60DRAFT_664078 [Scenedesmus sp. NREL 46B-D3]|nr:hypothetical protein COO60DRAFT_664078 [Scenedesmus sp. NREL 46B-D3]
MLPLLLVLYAGVLLFLLLQQAKAEMQALHAQLTGARTTAQAAAGERDKLEVKYRTYKAAARHQLAANEALQVRLQRAEAEAREAAAPAGDASAAATQKGGVGSWADAVSESEEEGGVGLRAAAGQEQVGAGGSGAAATGIKLAASDNA